VAEIIAERSGEDVSELEFLTFRDLDQSVRDDVERIRSLSQIPADSTVSGHVYDVRTGTLREVVQAE
jgi:carbonic anhydrase